MQPAETILVGYDGSQSADHALQRAAMIAGDAAPVVVVAVAETSLDSSSGDVIAGGLSAAEATDLMSRAQALLSARGVSATTRIEEGDAAEVLLRVARDVRAQLLIVGARGRDFVRRTLMGSVAAKLVEQAPCDVLVTR